MRAQDLAVEVPTVTPSASALDAVRTIAGGNLSAVLVVDDDDRPLAVLSGSQLVGFGLPQYVREDPSLAGVLDEGAAGAMARRLAATTIAQVLGDEEPDPHPVVRADDTLVEVVAVIADARVGLVPVVDADGRALGAITVPRLLDALMGL